MIHVGTKYINEELTIAVLTVGDPDLTCFHFLMSMEDANEFIERNFS